MRADCTQWCVSIEPVTIDRGIADVMEVVTGTWRAPASFQAPI
jgi:hypothetical protein